MGFQEYRESQRVSGCYLNALGEVSVVQGG